MNMKICYDEVANSDYDHDSDTDDANQSDENMTGDDNYYDDDDDDDDDDDETIIC